MAGWSNRSGPRAGSASGTGCPGTNGMRKSTGSRTTIRIRRPGLVEWFRPGEFERVESVLASLRALGVQELRTMVSWADWYASEGDGWYAWLLPKLAREVNVLPCFVHTPPSIGIVPKFSSP